MSLLTAAVPTFTSARVTSSAEASFSGDGVSGPAGISGAAVRGDASWTPLGESGWQLPTHDGQGPGLPPPQRALAGTPRPPRTRGAAGGCGLTFGRDAQRLPRSGRRLLLAGAAPVSGPPSPGAKSLRWEQAGAAGLCPSARMSHEVGSQGPRSGASAQGTWG